MKVITEVQIVCIFSRLKFVRFMPLGTAEIKHRSNHSDVGLLFKIVA